jgi:hypothetical protein
MDSTFVCWSELESPLQGSQENKTVVMVSDAV